jgi:hypothetical protein
MADVVIMTFDRSSLVSLEKLANQWARRVREYVRPGTPLVLV